MFLMIGANSEIAAATTRLLRVRGRNVLSTTRRTGDIGDGAVLLDFDASTAEFEPPPGVSSACIFVAVARLAACEADPAGSSLINCRRTIELVDRLTSRGIYTLFLSTNQVFDGETARVRADAAPCPVSAYGRQKAKTENALKARMAAGLPVGILRLAKVVSPGMTLIEGWKRELSANRTIRAFKDMTMAPTPSDLVAAAIAGMLEDRAPVVAQLTGPRDVAYADIGRFIASVIGADTALVEDVSALDHGMPRGATPRNTTLNSSYVAERYGLVAPDALDVVSGLL